MKNLMNRSKIYLAIITFLIFNTIIYSQNIHSPTDILGGELYTDSDGKVYMNINVLGHVKEAGNYKIYEGTDFLTILASAGGPLDGAKLSKIMVYRAGKSPFSINLNEYLLENDKSTFIFYPNDTIYIKQSNTSYILSKSSVLNTLLTLLNVFLIINNS